MLRWICVCLVCALGGCIDRVATQDGDRDAAAGTDAAVAGDSSVADAAVVDAAIGRPPDDFQSALSCGMSEAAFMTAIEHYRACRPSRIPTTALYESWRIGLLGFDTEVTPNEWLPDVPNVGCLIWQCFAEASSCFSGCATGEGLENCFPEEWCDDGRAVVCNAADAEHYQVADCGAMGMTCVAPDEFADEFFPVYCESPSCDYRNDPSVFACDGNVLTLCGDHARQDCGEAWPGGICTTRTIGTFEFAHCAPPGFDTNAPSAAVTCHPDGRIEFMALGIEPVEFDCRAQGYVGCNDAGCVAE